MKTVYSQNGDVAKDHNLWMGVSFNFNIFHSLEFIGLRIKVRSYG